MKHITFYLDFLSPYAYLAFEQLPQSLEGLSYSVSYRPVLLTALLQHHGQIAPVDIRPQRDWIYRHVLWLGHSHGIDIRLPATHPFNPLPHLRLALATSSDGDINRHVAHTLFRDIWCGGATPNAADRLAALATQLNIQRDVDGSAVKQQLRTNTEQAIAQGVFGVPAFEVEQRLFGGFDGLAMLRAYLHGEAWFEGPDWTGAAQ